MSYFLEIAIGVEIDCSSVFKASRKVEKELGIKLSRRHIKPYKNMCRGNYNYFSTGYFNDVETISRYAEGMQRELGKLGFRILESDDNGFAKFYSPEELRNCMKVP